MQIIKVPFGEALDAPVDKVKWVGSDPLADDTGWDVFVLREDGDHDHEYNRLVKQQEKKYKDRQRQIKAREDQLAKAVLKT